VWRRNPNSILYIEFYTGTLSARPPPTHLNLMGSPLILIHSFIFIHSPSSRTRSTLATVTFIRIHSLLTSFPLKGHASNVWKRAPILGRPNMRRQSLFCTCFQLHFYLIFFFVLRKLCMYEMTHAITHTHANRSLSLILCIYASIYIYIYVYIWLREKLFLTLKIPPNM
jgi:hypothetical protein